MFAKRLWIALPLLLALTGCPSTPPNASPYPYAGSTPQPSASDGLSGLVQQSNSQQQELSNNLNTPLTLNFPVRLGVLFYAYDASLKPEDQQDAMNAVQSDLNASGLVRSTVLIPPSLVGPNDNLEAIRQLVSRFRVDTLLIVSGSDTFGRADSQQLGFFDQFSNKASYEARTALTALGMSVLTGRFLAPLSSAGHAGPEVLNADSASFNADAYKLKKQAATDALMRLKDRFKDSLQALKDNPSPAPTQAPSPAPSASASP